MTQPYRTYGRSMRSKGLDRPHECNLYCDPARRLHATILFSHSPLPEDVSAIITGSQVIDVVDRRPAPEAPPYDPSDPAAIPFEHRTLIIGRARRLPA